METLRSHPVQAGGRCRSCNTGSSRVGRGRWKDESKAISITHMDSLSVAGNKIAPAMLADAYNSLS